MTKEEYKAEFLKRKNFSEISDFINAHVEEGYSYKGDIELIDHWVKVIAPTKPLEDRFCDYQKRKEKL